jgi:hypothetical protein
MRCMATTWLLSAVMAFPSSDIDTAAGCRYEIRDTYKTVPYSGFETANHIGVL